MLHVVVFHLFRYSGGNDLLRVWLPIARAVLEGRDPAPFIDNLYGPLFPFALAGGLGAFGGGYPPGIDLVFVIADGASLWLLFRIALRRMSEPVARRLTLAILVSPLLWHGVIVRTQDEPLFVFFLLLTLDSLERGRETLAVSSAVLGTLFTKALFPLWVLPVLLAAGGGWRRLLLRIGSAGALTAAGMALYIAFGWDLQGRFHPTLDLRGSTTWFLFAGGGQPSSTAFRLGLVATALLCIAAGCAAVLRNAGEGPFRSASRGVVAVQAAFLVASPFSLPPHLVHGLPMLAWQAVDEGACEPRPPWRGIVLGLGFCLWQIPALWINSEFWSTIPLLIAGFALYWAWTGWIALARRASPA